VITCAALISRQLSERTALRLALPSKGRMAEDTIELFKVCRPSVSSRPFTACNGRWLPLLPALSVSLCGHSGFAGAPNAEALRCQILTCNFRAQDCQLSVYKPNPRQYVATISQVISWNR